jgi:DNA repair protein RecN (Recombination protein N)
MLCELRIENLALISALALNFDHDRRGGLIVMTGETGAGKSIMLRAIDLLTGGRASADWIRNGEENCVVEALFAINPEHHQLLSRLDEDGLRDGETVIIKRVINVSGRSKLYVNGSMATARQVAELTADMLSVAGQHDHQQLLQTALHLDFLDTLGDLWPERQELGESYRYWQERSAALSAARKAERDKEQRRDFLAFQLAEIRKADVQPGEDEELAAEKKRLKSADILIKLSQESYYLLSGDILEMMVAIRKNMEQIVALDPQAKNLAEDLGGYTFLAEDFVQQLRHYRDGLASNPLRLEQVTERLDMLQQLKRKYGESLEAVLAFARNAEEELARIENMDREIQLLAAEVQRLEEDLCRRAERLSQKRRAQAAEMEKAMSLELSSLAFNQSAFEVRWQEVEHRPENLRASGWDRLEFFFSANPGEPARPLVKVASGGELSRLMLAMKCLLAKKDMVDTVIFDEVDAGIGGEAAEAVARKIKELATHHQVFCITHLPQIAARGTQHFQVSKVVDDGRTQSSVARLSAEERVGELARMLAGESVSTQTEAWARELLVKGSAAA